METVKIVDLKPGMEILVRQVFFNLEEEVTFTKHTVSHTSAGHPGKLKVFCANGFTFTEQDDIFLFNAVSQTYMLLEGKEAEDYDEL